MMDLCVATGAKFITREKYPDFKAVKLTDFRQS